MPQATMIMESQRDGLVRFIMILLGISAATYHGKNTARAIYNDKNEMINHESG